MQLGSARQCSLTDAATMEGAIAVLHLGGYRQPAGSLIGQHLESVPATVAVLVIKEQGAQEGKACVLPHLQVTLPRSAWTLLRPFRAVVSN